MFQRTHANSFSVVNMMFSIAILGSVLSFLPFYGFSTSVVEENSENGIQNSSFYRESSIATLILIIPTSMDIILDVLLMIADVLTAGKNGTVKKPLAPLVIVRLTVAERSLFVVGVAMQCLVTFVPIDPKYLIVLYHCTSNCSTVLTLCPILMFLERCTITWTCNSTISVAIFTAVGAALNSFSYCFDSDMSIARQLYFAGSIFFVLAALIYILISSLCASFYVKEKSRAALIAGIGLSSQGGLKKEIKVVDEMYENYIPAAHIFSGIMFVILNATWNRFTADSGIMFGKINYVLIGIATWVLVVEFRIRKNEVERGLMSIGFKNALLDSKKSYIRYISHELRTPLNTAYLGLKLLSEKADPSDLDGLDTVADVTAACKTAVDILNDLLCFDMLESGILELHKQEVAVLPFLYDNIKLFSSQARGNGVDLTVSAGCIDLDEHSTGAASILTGSWVARPLHSEDCMYVDKFKMDQVIRNLISNALKFTPRGGSVSVTATFVPEYVEGGCKSHKSRSTSEFPRNITTSESFQGHPRKGLTNHLSFRRIYADENLESFSTGAGISESNQKRLFNEIVQFNPEVLQAGGGSGLGLWITRGIVDLHLSTISVFSAGEGMGCVFTLEIPMSRKFNLHNTAPPDPSVGLGALSRRASVNQEEAMAMRRSESWRYMLRQLDTLVVSDRDFPIAIEPDRERDKAEYKDEDKVTVKEKDKQEGRNSVPISKVLPRPHSSKVECVASTRVPFPLDTDASPRLDSSSAKGPFQLFKRSSSSQESKDFNGPSPEKGDDPLRILTTGRDDGGKPMTFGALKSWGQKHQHNHYGVYPNSTPLETPSTSRSSNSPTRDRCAISCGILNPKFLDPKDRRVPDMQTPVTKDRKQVPPCTVEPCGVKVSYDLLVVDDSRLNRKMLCKVLRSKGHVCDEAEDGWKALEKVKERMGGVLGNNIRHFDAILMDFVMPNMDGPTATKEIRALGYTAPIFGVTGNSLPSDVEHFIMHGANVVLIKPLDVDDFKRAMQDVEQLVVTSADFFD